MQEVSFRDSVVEISSPKREVDGWWIQVRARQNKHIGPFATLEAAQEYRVHRFILWGANSIRRGGWLWKKTEELWVATLPESTGSDGVLLRSEPCSRPDFGILESVRV